jgi:hypothetical protein
MVTVTFDESEFHVRNVNVIGGGCGRVEVAKK